MSNASTDSDVTPPMGSPPAPAEVADPTDLNLLSTPATEAGVGGVFVPANPDRSQGAVGKPGGG